MKAIVYEGFGTPDILRYQEVGKPVPADHEMVVKVRAAGLNPLDWKVLKGGPFPVNLLLGLGKPKLKRAGIDVAGEVEAVGSRVIDFKPGDAVFGCCEGALAEFVSFSTAKGSKGALVPKPETVSFEHAASAPIAALTALQGLRDHGRLQSGQTVLINGAAGGVGSFAVQIAKVLGATVTAVCSTRNVEMVRSIGADDVIDYTQQDFTRSGRQWDLVFDCIGNHKFSESRRVLTPKGTLIIIGGPADQRLTDMLSGILGMLLLKLVISQRMLFFMAKAKPEDLTTIAELMASGKVKPVIDRTYPLSQAPDAFRYLQQGHARGKVLLVPAE
jgi:NADPH:quinone reductase-like Zn-dependent oxidoreductase